MLDEIPLERGLCFYYEQQGEFERKELPIEKQVAIAFEVGRQVGKCEVKSSVAMIFKPDSGNIWP